MADLTPLLSQIDTLRPKLEELYRHLHAHPELSNAEVETAARMAQEMRNLGLEVHENVGASTGVVALLRNGEGPTVLLRADMDGLPVQEVEKVEYRSTVRASGPDGEVPVMHACGHDTHMTSLVGAVKILAGSTDAWSGTLVALFQPAEEVVNGASGMADQVKELLDGHLDVALGQHVWPAQAGTVQVRPGPMMASVDSIEVTLHGVGGHGSQPENTVDPVVLAAQCVVRLQTVVSREVKPAEMAVVTVGRMVAGTKSNIIPAKAELSISIRTYDEQVREHVKAAVVRIIDGECATTGRGASAEYRFETQAPVTDNDPEATARLQAAFDEHFGDQHELAESVAGSEDFGVIPTAFGAPYVFWFLGGFEPGHLPSNHAPDFIPVVQPTLDAGVKAMVVAAMTWLGR